MEGFVWLCLLSILVTGLLGHYTDNEVYMGLQFACMLGMIVGVPILSVILYM